MGAKGKGKKGGGGKAKGDAGSTDDTAELKKRIIAEIYAAESIEDYPTE